MTVEPVGSCRCGHDQEHHEHYRDGSDCSRCTCARFRPPAGRPPVSPELRRLLAVVLGVPLSIVTIAAVTEIAGPDGVPIAVAALLAVVGGLCAIYLVRR